MASLVRNILAGVLGSPALLHPRETQLVTGAFAAANAEIITDCDGSGVVSLDISGTFVATVEVSGTIDGVRWFPIALRPINIAAKLYVVTASAAGGFVGSCAGYRKVRVRCTAFTSGSMLCTLTANTGLLDQTLEGMIAVPITVTAAVGVAATLPIPSPGGGLRNYVSYIAINRIASALLTAGAAPVVVTTTNLPNSMAFSLPADAAAQGTIYPLREDFAFPLMSTAQGTATTIVAPATPNVIWRLSAAYYVAP